MKLSRIHLALFLLVGLGSLSPLAAQTIFHWDTDGSAGGNDPATGTGFGGTGIWDGTTANWWNGATFVPWPNSGSDTAIFTGPESSGSSTVTLSGPIAANQLSFQRSGYTLSGGALSLAGADPTVRVNLAESATIESAVSGGAGLIVDGGGNLYLKGANTYTGTTLIHNGSLVIGDPSALGVDGSPVVVTGSNLRSGGGGQLVLDGTGGGMNFTRDLNLQGYGPIADRSGALLSFGSNEVSGLVITGEAGIHTRIVSSHGMLTLSGGLHVGGTPGSTQTLIGGTTATGAGNYRFTGPLTGEGILVKAGAGTLILDPSDSSGFSGIVRTTGSTANALSSIRVVSTSAFGTRNGFGTTAQVDLNGGMLEIRMDTPSFDTVSANVHLRTGTNLFVDHAIGSSAINGTATFGRLDFTSGQSLTLNSRNGYGTSFSSTSGGAIVVAQPTAAATTTITNNGGGTLTIGGNLWNVSNVATAQTLNLAGSGNTLVTGSLVANGTGAHVLNKSGNGLLTVNGTGSNFTGTLNVTGGAVAITDFRSLNMQTGSTNTAGQIHLGTTGVASNTGLIIGTGLTPSAGGLTTNKDINLAGTTGSGHLYANQPGVNPVVLNGNITATGEGAKNLVLGGTNTSNNIINGAISNGANSTVTSLQKIGSGTWVLAGANAYTGTTTIANGTLKLLANAPTSTVLSGTNAITFSASNGYTGGTLEFVGRAGENNVQNLGNLSYANGGANTLRVTPGAGGTASITFANINTGGAGTLNIVGADFTNNQVTFALINNGSPSSNGILTRSVYWNGADYAYRQGAVMRAPVYGVDPGTNTTATAFTSHAHQQITGSFATNSISSIQTLKIAGSHTLTVNAGQTLTLTGAGILATGGNSTITGGTVAMGTQPLVARVNEAGDILTIASNMTGTAGLTKSGAGTLVLAGNNTVTGNVNLAEGTIRLSGGGTLSGANAALNIRQGATLDLNGVSTGSSIGAFNNVGLVTNSSATAATLTVGNNNQGGTSYGIVEDGVGVVNVVKTGTGNQGWLGLSTYTGTTTLGGGIVTLEHLADGGQASGIGASSSDASNLIFSGGGLSYRGFNLEGTLTSPMGSRSTSTDRLFTLAGSGNVGTLSSNTNNNNAVVWSNHGDIAHQGQAARTLVLDGGSQGDNTFNPRLTDSGTGANITSLRKQGTGLWVLGNANNAYSGNTTVANGMLVLAGPGSLPSASHLVLGDSGTAGILQADGVFDRSNVSWGAGGTGGGFAASGDKLIVALGGIASPTPLVWGTSNFVGNGQALHLNSTTAVGEVELRNHIDLNGAVRTIQVNDNGFTATDFATISGVISGTGGLNKTGAGNGVLQLLGENTYTGTTQVSAGVLVVNSLGHSTDLVGTGTSVGASGVTFGNSNAILLGNGTTVGGLLQYIGAGETSDRKIQLNTTTAQNQIHADGPGALILTNVANDAVAGAKILGLRGSSTAGNTIASNLADNGGALGITVSGNAVWILAGNNSHSGTTFVEAGALGLGHDSALGNSTLLLASGSVFAHGADRVVTNVVQQSSGQTTAFIGDHNLGFASPFQLLTTTGTAGIVNGIADGSVLEFGNITANSLTGTGTLLFQGTGDTIVGGNITTSSPTQNLNVTYNGTGSLTLAGTASDINAGVLTVSNGTLKVGADNALGSMLQTNLVMNPVAGNFATLDLNGHSDSVRGISATGPGTAMIDNSAATAATLTLGAGDANTNFVGYISNTGSGALSIAKEGAGEAVFSGGTYDHTGATSVTGGSLIYAGDVSGTTSLSVTNAGSSLAFTGGLSGAGGIDSLVVGAGASLILLDGLGSQSTSLNHLALGTGSSLYFNVGDGGATDTLGLLGGGVLDLGNNITFHLTDTGLSANSTYTLLSSADGGLTLGDFALGALGGFGSASLDSDGYSVWLNTGALDIGDLYWRGSTDGTWNTVGNWSTTKDGTGNATSVPGQGHRVVFATDGIGAGPVTTTLEQNFRIDSLVFESGATTTSSVTINPGGLGSARLEIAPGNATDGIAISSGGPAAVNLNTAVQLGADQTWNVADAGAVLTIGGALRGEAGVTQTGAGKVVLGSAADGTFNTGQTASWNVQGGTLEIQNTTALGSTLQGNLAGVKVGSGGAFYYNGVAGTVANALELAGGTLSVGGGTDQTYSGDILVSADSSINLRDSNSAVLSTTARNVVLTGQLSGTGQLSVDSVDTPLSAGNPITGVLRLVGDNSAWSGGLDLTRGTVTVRHVNALGTGDITASGGRLFFDAPGGSTYDLAQSVTVAPGGTLVLEAAAGGSGGGDMTVNFHGDVVLGDSTAGATLRLFQSTNNRSLLNLDRVVLGNHSTIATGGSLDRAVTIHGIDEIAPGSVLTINEPAWSGQRTLAITGPSTYSGGTNLVGGTLELGHRQSLGTGALNVTTATGTLRAGTDLSGINAVANDVTLNANLIVAGSNSLTLSGAFVGTGGNVNRALTNNLTSGTLELSGPIAIAPAAGNTAARTLNINGTGNTLISGNISNGNGFNNALAKGGTGTLTLAGVNSYTGGTHIQGGTVVLASNTALPTNGGVWINGVADNGTLDINGTSNSILGIVLGQTGNTVANLNYQIVDSLGTGTLTLGGTVTYNVGATGLHNGQATISANLDLGGATRTFSVNDSSNAAVDLLITGNIGGTGGLSKSGLGTLELAGANTYTGSTNVFHGTLRLGADNVLPGTSVGVGSTSATGGTLDLNGHTDAVGGLWLGNGGTTVGGLVNQVVDSAGGGLLTLGGSVTYDPGTAGLHRAQGLISANLDLGTLGLGSFGRIFNVGDSTHASADVDLRITGNISGNASFDKQGAGTLRLDGNNTWTGDTTITAGTLLLGSNNALPGGTVFINGATTAGILDIGGTTNTVNILTLGRNATAAGGLEHQVIDNVGGGKLVLGSHVNYNAGNPGLQNGQATISANLDLGATGARSFNVADSSNSAVELLISGNIGGAAGLTKTGTGVMRFAGSNNYTGATTISGGVLEAGAANTFSAASAHTVEAGTTLRLNGFNNTIGSLTGSAGAIVENGAASNAALTTGGNVDTTFAGTIRNGGTGNLGLVKTGTGRLFLTGANTYTGPTVINGGQLRLGNGGTTGSLSSSSTISIASGSTFLIERSNTVTQGIDFSSSAITGGGQFVQLGTGTTILTAANTYTGGTLVYGGTLRLGNDHVLPNAQVVVGNSPTGATLDLNGHNDTIGSLTLGVASTTVGGLVNQVVDSAGGGLLTLGGSVIYNPGTTGFHRAQGLISANLDLGGSTRFFDVGNSTHASAADVDLRITGDIGGSGSLVKSGLGTLELAGANTYTGTTNIINGTLKLGADHVLPDTFVGIGNTAATGGTLDLNGHTDTIGGLALGAGSTTVGGLVNRVVDSAGGGLLTLGGTVTYDPGTAGLHRAQGLISANLDLAGVTRTFNVGDSTHSSAADVDLRITGNIEGSAGLEKVGLGTLELAGVSTYTGLTYVNNGTLRLGADNALPNTEVSFNGLSTGGTLDLNGHSTTIGNLYLGNFTTTVGGLVNRVVDSAGGGLLTLGGNVTYATGTAGFHRGQATISANLDLGATGTRTFNVGDSNNAAVELLVSGDISGAAGLTKTGTGVLRFEGANTYTGTTTINGGVLEAGAANALSDASAHVLGSAGTLRLDGNSNAIGSLAGVAGSVVENGSAASAVLTVGGNDADTIFAGTLRNGGTGALSLVKTGAGILSLVGVNTYTGDTTVEGGTLRLDYSGNNDSKLADGGALILSGGTVDLAGGSHLEQVGSTVLTAGTANTISRSSGAAILALGNITAGNGATLNILGDDIASTTTANVGGILGMWATVTNGTGIHWATNSGDLDVSGGGKIQAYAHTGTEIITNLSSGADTIGNNPNSNVKIAEGTGAPRAIELEAPTTTISSLKAENTTEATIDQGGNTLNIGNGATNSGAILVAGQGGLVVEGGELSAGGAANGQADTLLILQNSPADLKIDSKIVNNFTDTLGLIKDGNGTLILTGDNTYSGPTEVLAGTLLVNNTTGSGTGSGAVTVASGATLGGNGTIGGPTTISGIHSPGNSPDVQTFNSHLTYTTGASVLWELVSNTAGDIIQTSGFQFDQIVVKGDLTFEGTTEFVLDFNSVGPPDSTVNWTDPFWAADQRWLVYQVEGTTIGFNQLSLGIIDYSALADGSDPSKHLGAVNSLGRFSLSLQGNDIYLNYAAVPEPSSALILLGGLATMLMGRRRRRLAS